MKYAKAFAVALFVSGLLNFTILPCMAQTRSSANLPIVPSAKSGKAIPATEAIRFVIPSYVSEAEKPTRSFAAVTVTNNSAATCSVSVAFQYAGLTTDECVATVSVAGRTSRIICSRPVNDPVIPCSVSCSPGLTFHVGHAYVTSTKGDACSKISVDAQQFYTRDPADDTVESQSRLTVHKFTGFAGD